MTAYEIIDKKKKKLKLSAEEIKWFIQSYLKKEIHDYQMSALLMAIFLNGMDESETAALTDAMLYSGITLQFDGKNVIDKHSTGGIGDKASFILAPIAAAAGVKVPMIAGRGLGYTGGTVDKIEAINGFNTALSIEEFKKLLDKNGLVLIGQTPDIAPADKQIYALRDVTATIDSIPLITASIMSKKLAEGANGIVMDIKLGSGAFMRNKSDAKKLAISILKTAKRFKRKSIALITDMNQPLGNAVGHSLELIESVQTLKGQGPKDLTELSLALASHMIHLAGITKNFKDAQKLAQKTIDDGSAFEKFKLMVKEQGGDVKQIENLNLLPMATMKTDILAPQNGYIKMFQNDQIGFLCTELGGGRKVKTDKIDFAVGFIVHKKIGDQVKKGECLATIYHHANQEKLAQLISQKWTKNITQFSKTKIKKNKTIIETIKLS